VTLEHLHPLYNTSYFKVVASLFHSYLVSYMILLLYIAFIAYKVLLHMAGLHKCWQSIWRWTSTGYICVAKETWEGRQVRSGKGRARKDSEDKDDGKQGTWFVRHCCLYMAVASYTHTHTHNRFTALWNLSGKTRVSRYQKKHSPTTLIVVINHPYQLSPSSTIHGILPIQSTCSTVFFHNLSPVAS